MTSLHPPRRDPRRRHQPPRPAQHAPAREVGLDRVERHVDPALVPHAQVRGSSLTALRPSGLAACRRRARAAAGSTTRPRRPASGRTASRRSRSASPRRSATAAGRRSSRARPRARGSATARPGRWTRRTRSRARPRWWPGPAASAPPGSPGSRRTSRARRASTFAYRPARSEKHAGRPRHADAEQVEERVAVRSAASRCLTSASFGGVKRAEQPAVDQHEAGEVAVARAAVEVPRRVGDRHRRAQRVAAEDHLAPAAARALDHRAQVLERELQPPVARERRRGGTARTRRPRGSS